MRAAKALSPPVRAAVLERVSAAAGQPAPGDATADRLMSADEVRALAADGHEIGSHTRTHPILTQLRGDALTDEEKATLDEFIAGLAAGALGEEGGLNLYTGPLNFQDGSVYLEDGAAATERQIWFAAANADEATTPEEVTPPQLLEGIEGTTE